MSSQDRIMKKISKCLALSQSNNPHEAGRALAQAKKLMEMHGINHSDLDMASVQDATMTVTKAQKIPKHLRHLITIMHHVFGVRCVTVERHGGSTVQFIGFDEAPDIAGYAYEVLAAQMKADRKTYLKSLDRSLPASRKARLADIFCLAWSQSVYEKVEALKTDVTREDLINKWIESEYGKIKDRRTRTTYIRSKEEDEALNEGRETGKGANLFHGMNGSRGQSLLTSE